MIRYLAVAAQLAAQGHQPESICVTRQEANDMIVVAAPYFIEAAAQRCVAQLPAEAFLRSEAGARAMVSRFRAETDSRIASALRGFVKVSGHPNTEVRGDPQEVLDNAGRQAASEIVGGMSPGKCASVSALLETIAPLPADNVGRLMTALFQLVGRGGRDSMNICP
jgi:hypothetical protein